MTTNFEAKLHGFRRTQDGVVKKCAQCGAGFSKGDRSERDFARMECCSRRCAATKPRKGGLIARFNDKWLLCNSGCHTWTGAISPKGYAMFRYAGGTGKAHRFAYQMANGAVPPGYVVMHVCDNRACVNPAHLRAGSQIDNIADMVAKGRSAKGSAASKAKLTERQVLAIRASSASQKDLATKYGVKPSAISQIKSRKVWGHI